MSGNETKQNIQEMEQGQKDFGIISTAKNLHKNIVNNQLVSEFDVFSVPVKLTMKGEEQYKTCCGGLMYLGLLAFCMLLTLLVIFPNGVQLNSELNIIMIPNDSGDTGQTLFDNTDEIISFRGIRKNTTAIIGYENISSYVTLRAYQKDTNNITVPLQISTDCRPGYEFCLKKTQANKNAKIFGNYFLNGTFSKYLVFEAIWCNTSVPATCPTFSRYSMQMSLSNFYKKKGGELQQYQIRNIYSFGIFEYTNNMTREQFTSNDKFRGHLSNILPFTVQSYLFNNDISRVSSSIANLITQGTFTGRRFFQVKILPIGQTKLIEQNFDDISDVLLFFLSVKETLYILLFIIFIKQYNRNSGLLDVGNSLFYIDDPKTKMKYDFNRGFDVFVACLFHNHPVTNIIQFIMTKMGKTLQDFFPTKSFCAIKLMGKAQQILQQNAFYGNLNELSSMEGESSKKIPLVEQEKSYQNQQQVELSYFPIHPTDCETQKRQKEMKREAFKQFCEANEHLSPQRKNFIYKVLTDNKLKHVLVHEVQKSFKQFLRNVRIQMSNDIYQQVEEEEFSQIKVAVHDTSSHPMTAQNFIRT